MPVTYRVSQKKLPFVVSQNLWDILNCFGAKKVTKIEVCREKKTAWNGPRINCSCFVLVVGNKFREAKNNFQIWHAQGNRDNNFFLLSQKQFQITHLF